MVICCIPLCGSRSDRRRNIDKDGNKITFHEFPSDPLRKQQWMTIITEIGYSAIKRWRPLDDTSKLKICNLHFHPSDFKQGKKIKRLLPEVVPTLFPDYQIQKKNLHRIRRVYHVESDNPAFKVACNEMATNYPEESFVEPQKLVNTNSSVISTSPLQINNFEPDLKMLCLLPVVPGSFSACVQSILKKEAIGREREDDSITKAAYNKTLVTAHIQPSLHLAKVSVNNGSVENGNSEDETEKDTASYVDNCFTYCKLLKDLSLIIRPNQFWGITPTDKFTIFSKWNENYIAEKRIVIDDSLSIKVFLGELEINIMNLMELTCIEEVSALLEKVEEVKFS